MYCHAPHGACELKCIFITRYEYSGKSRSPRSVWVEIARRKKNRGLKNVTLPTERVSWNDGIRHRITVTRCHAPHGACELKSPDILFKPFILFVTLPTERVSWNVLCFIDERIYCCHAPHGACELKFFFRLFFVYSLCHAPHGACELKYQLL